MEALTFTVDAKLTTTGQIKLLTVISELSFNFEFINTHSTIASTTEFPNQQNKAFESTEQADKDIPTHLQEEQEDHDSEHLSLTFHTRKCFLKPTDGVPLEG